MLSIDLNCDMGESFGAWTMGNDRALMDYCTSVNIACGFHAGDATVIRQTIETALEKQVAVGAHPSFPDLQGFGRRAMNLSPQEVFDVVLYQVAAIYQMTTALGGRLHHVKPHGALYNEAAKKPEPAAAIVRAVKAVDGDLIFFGLSGSFLISEAEKIGLRTASEVFADRTYQPNGNLTPRSESNALIHDSQQAIEQVLQMVETQTVTATNGAQVPLRAETVCIHGDGANALEFASAVREALEAKGIAVRKI
jgi:5-oxoprolinase (ATP-hydrolysing) subunit A